MRLKDIFKLTENPLKIGGLLALLNSYFVFILLFLTPQSVDYFIKINTSLNSFLITLFLYFFIWLVFLVLVWILFANKLPLFSIRKTIQSSLIGATPFIILEAVILALFTVVGFEWFLFTTFITTLLFILSNIATLLIIVKLKNKKAKPHPSLSLS